MSDYKQGDWSEILDGLYWRFVAKNIEKLKANPRLSLLKNTLNNMDAGRRKTIIQRAEQFISSNCE